MTMLEAMKKLTAKYPERIVIGYWVKDGDYIFNTKTLSFRNGITEPGQYIVTKTGEIYGTNPMRIGLDISTMKKI